MTVVQLPQSLRTRRRWPWMLFAILGLIGLAGWWWVPMALTAIAQFNGLDLGEKDSVSSIISMLVGIASLLASVILNVYPRQPRSAQPLDSRSMAAARLQKHLGRRTRLRLVGDRDTRPLSLRVHQAIELESGDLHPRRRWKWFSAHRSLDSEAPIFVRREISPELCNWMKDARRTGGFLILVGNSSVGKTRLLYETAREVLADFALLAPDLGDGELVNALAATPWRESKGLLVWLDELQRFLPGPYFVESGSEGHIPITSTAVRQLLDAKTPVIIAGTLWPEFDIRLRESNDAASGDLANSRYPQAVDILEQASRTFFVDTFSESERATAIGLASHDPRLAQAVVSRDFNVTETLAGAREIMRRYQQAPETHKAIVHAAADARRAGILSPITRDLLSQVSQGYLTGVQPRAGWFDEALAELSNRSRRQDRATAPVIELPNADRTEIRGITLADYLLQHLSMSRRYQPIPEHAWRILTQNIENQGDLRRLAVNAANRLYYSEAEMAYRRLILTEDQQAAARFSSFLHRRGRTQEAIALLEDRLAQGDQRVLSPLGTLLAKAGRVHELRELALTGDPSVAQHLAGLLVKIGAPDALSQVALTASTRAGRRLLKEAPIDQLRSLAAGGYEPAIRRLVEVLSTGDDADELRVLADGESDIAKRALASMLVEQGDTFELRRRADQGDPFAARGFAALLIRRGDVDGLRELARAGAPEGVISLARLYRDREQLDDEIALLREHLTDDDAGAIAARLADALVAAGEHDAAIEVLEHHPTDSRRKLASVLVDANRHGEALEALRKPDEKTDVQAIHRLVTALWNSSRRVPALSMLRELVQRGDIHAADRLAKYLAEDGQLDELRLRAASGDRYAVRRYAKIAARTGRSADAVLILRDAVKRGDDGASHLLSGLLAKRGDVDELTREVDAGTPGAGGHLIDLLSRTGEPERADRLRTVGRRPRA